MVVFGVRFSNRRSSRAFSIPGKWAANGRTLATRSVHLVHNNPCSDDPTWLNKMSHLCGLHEKRLYIVCTIQQKVTASGQHTAELVPQRFNEWQAQGEYRHRVSTGTKD